MKRNFIFFLAFIAIALTAQAQYFTIGPEVGYERASLHVGSSKNERITIHTGNGFTIGASAAYKYGNGLFLQSGLRYSRREGTRLYGVSSRSQFPFVKDIEVNTSEFLTIPLTVGYELPIGSNWGIGIKAGGYWSVGLGKGSSFFRCTNGEGSSGSVFDDSLFTVGIPDSDRREKVTINGSDRIDAGCLFGGHIRFKHIKFHASYQLGLCKTIYNMAMPRTITISLSYDFRL